VTRHNSTSAVRRTVILTVAVALVAGAALATNGYLVHGIGTRAKALAGAGAAFPQDALAAATNPAGLAFLNKRYDGGVALFRPSRQYTVTGGPSLALGTFGLFPGTVKSDSEAFVVPNFGALWETGGGSSIIGLSIYGQGGMNTDYPTNTFFGTQPVGVDLSQMFIVPAWATRLGGGQHAIGIAPILGVQFFEVQGIQAFAQFSSDPAKLTNNGHDQSIGFGARFGYQGRFPNGFSLGFSWQSEIDMDEFSDYSGLFAGRGDFDIPSNWVVGIAYELGNDAVFMLDYQEILYSDIAAVGNGLFPALGQAFMGNPAGLLGAPTGPGFGWQDMSVIKAGFQWGSGQPWTWRAGFSTGDQPITPSEVFFNILAPGVMEEHLTAGFSRKTGGGELNFSFMYAPSVSVSGPNPLEVPGTQTIALEMDQMDIEIGYSWGF
jgi:long-chain fatty acid transport protein